METETGLPERIEVLEAMDAVRELRHRFNELLDSTLESYSAEGDSQLRGLITPDFRWTSKLHGSIEGADAFAELVREKAAACTMSFRIVASDLHHPSDDSDTATATWSSLGMLTVNGQQLWVASAHTDTYRRADGAWLIAGVDTDYKFVCRYEDGWSDDRFVEEALLSLVL